MYTHTHIYNMQGIGVTKTTSSAFASGKEGVRGALSPPPPPPFSLSLSPFSSIKWMASDSKGGSGYLLSHK